MTTRRFGWKHWLGLLGIFVAGAVTGVFGAAGYVHHWIRDLHTGGPSAVHALGIEWLDSKLDLTAEQESAIEAIIRDAHVASLRFKVRHQEEVRAIVYPALERVDALLDDTQRAEWQRIRERIVEHIEFTGESKSDS